MGKGHWLHLRASTGTHLVVAKLALIIPAPSPNRSPGEAHCVTIAAADPLRTPSSETVICHLARRMVREVNCGVSRADCWEGAAGSEVPFSVCTTIAYPPSRAGPSRCPPTPTFLPGSSRWLPRGWPRTTSRPLRSPLPMRV